MSDTPVEEFILQPVNGAMAMGIAHDREHGEYYLSVGDSFSRLLPIELRLVSDLLGKFAALEGE